MSKRHGSNPLVGQLKLRYWMLVTWLILLLVSFFATKGYLAVNLVDFLGLTPADATQPLTTKEALGILGKLDWFVFLKNFVWFAALAYALSFLAFLYKLWDALPPHRAHMSPIKATLPLFLPLINVYWLFVSVMGFVKDANKVLSLRNIENKNINADVAMCTCITSLMSGAVIAPGILSVLGDIFVLVHLIFMCMFAAQANTAALSIIKTNRSHVPERQPLMERNAPMAVEK